MFAIFLDTFSERILAVKGKLVEPDVARHMFAVVESDSFPAIDLVKFRSVDVMYDLGILPSPVDPKMRNLEFCCCWSLGSKVPQGDDEKVLIDLLVLQRDFT